MAPISQLPRRQSPATHCWAWCSWRFSRGCRRPPRRPPPLAPGAAGPGAGTARRGSSGSGTDLATGGAPTVRAVRLDAFGGGFVIQSIAAYWFYVRFGVSASVLGGIFFGANLLAGLSALLAARLASRFGLISTMVFTHLPSNVLLILVPLMPNLPLAVAVLFLRFSISQMDVPTRQSYVMAVVPPEERSAAAGVTGVARTTGAAISPLLAGVSAGPPRHARLALLPGRRAEDRLRPASVPRLYQGSSAGRDHSNATTDVL